MAARRFINHIIFTNVSQNMYKYGSHPENGGKYDFKTQILINKTSE